MVDYPPFQDLDGGDAYRFVVVTCGPWSVGARLSRFIDKWHAITMDTWVLSIVREGYRRTLVTDPHI